MSAVRILIFRVGRYSIIQGEKGCCRSYVAAIICESARVPSRRKKKRKTWWFKPQETGRTKKVGWRSGGRKRGESVGGGRQVEEVTGGVVCTRMRLARPSRMGWRTGKQEPRGIHATWGDEKNYQRSSLCHNLSSVSTRRASMWYCQPSPPSLRNCIPWRGNQGTCQSGLYQ